MIAVVLGVMAASILLGSRLQVSGSMSTKTGLIPFHQRECVVATITSPVILIACKAVIKGRVPFVNKLR